jgi:hypothetical protein
MLARESEVAFDADLAGRLAKLTVFSARLQDARYLKTYPLLISYFHERVAVASPRAEDVRIGVILVYSWMGRGWSNFDPACLEAFHDARQALGHCVRGQGKKDQFEAIKSFVGGSLIAASKFLHFLAPERYAIWDQHVARAAYGLNHWAQYNQIERYCAYLDDLTQLTLPSDLRSRIERSIGKTSDLRAKEFALFQLGLSMLKPKRA